MAEKLKIGIIGSGMIGAAYAALFTGHGYPVALYDLNEELLDAGKEKYEGFYNDIEARGLCSKAQRDKAGALLTGTLSLSDMDGCDIIFECITEDIEMKKKLYARIEEEIGDVKAIVSTSSALSPDDLISDMQKFRSRLVVGHPFNPPHLVLFVELVRSKETEEDVVGSVKSFLESCGRKVGVMKTPAPGFIANRLQHALLREATYLVDAGLVSCPEDVDMALTYSFLPRYTKVGLFEHHDFFGMDNTQRVQNTLCPSLCTRQEASEMVSKLAEKGDLGMKTGKGIYEWDDEKIADFKKRAAEPYWGSFNWKFDDDA